MARAIWTGALSFGLVNVDVGLYSATEDRGVRFRQFQRGTSSRIRYRRVNEDTGEEVDYADIVKGYDMGDGRYVLVAPEELEAVEPGRTRTIDISDFVAAEEIDPIFFVKSYYLAPRTEASSRAYALLLEAMRRTSRVAIATFVMRSKQYLAAVRADEHVLVLETMHFADEVRDPREEVEPLPVETPTAGRELDMAVGLVESLTTAFDPSNYRDTYRERVLELVEAKAEGDEVVTEGAAPESGDVVDLVEALRASVEAAKQRAGPGNTATPPTPLRRRPREQAAEEHDDLADLTKAELYDRAKALDVAGRSTLDRDELEQAVREAQSAGQQAS